MYPVTPIARSATPAACPSVSEYYVLLTRRALLDLRNNALAIGVYALIIRMYRATRQAVPLSAADIIAFDPSATHSTATRAIQRLIGLGYIQSQRRRGQKSLYIPTWGYIGSTIRPFDLNASGLGHRATYQDQRLPQRLLDTYIGRLEPHRDYAAVATRYTTRSLLRLSDVGVYALAMAGLPHHSQALEQLGLLSDGRPQPLPSDEELLARLSEGSIIIQGEAAELSDAGVARMASLARQKSCEDQKPQVIASPDPIAPLDGTPIGRLIAQSSPDDQSSEALESQETLSVSDTPNAHGFRSKEGIDPPSNPPRPVGNGGGGIFKPKDAPAPNPVEMALLRIGVRRDVAATLADRHLDQVERVIVEARARPGVRCLAAWVVSALRVLPQTEATEVRPPKVSDRAILLHRGLSNAERVRWLTRFRNADLFDRPAILARFHKEHPPLSEESAPDTQSPDGLSLTSGQVQ